MINFFKFNLPVPHGGLGKGKLEKFDHMISIVQKFSIKLRYRLYYCECDKYILFHNSHHLYKGIKNNHETVCIVFGVFSYFALWPLKTFPLNFVMFLTF